MQLGFLRLKRPPDVPNYLPSFCERKKISSSADDDLGPALKTRKLSRRKFEQRLYSSRFLSACALEFKMIFGEV